MQKKMKNYFIGLDMGTDSIGWAVTDTDYNLIKDHGTDYWGSYLFEPANSAEGRRMFRTARRRLKRRHRRLMLLQELFADEMSKTDPLFFLRLNNSNLLMEDKDESVRSGNYLFDDPEYSDKEYFKKYPTVYHLRKACVMGEVDDIRLLYLAVHHIIKNRGHFLFEEQNFEAGDNTSVKESFQKLNNIFYDMGLPMIRLENIDEILVVLEDEKIAKKEKEKRIINLAGVADTGIKALVAAVCGYKFNAGDLFRTDRDLGDFQKITFDGGFDESAAGQLEDYFDEEECAAIILLKNIYDWTVLNRILGGEKYISWAKVDGYEEHKNDLVLLKEYVKIHCPEKYKLVFRKNDEKNYAAYVGKDRKKYVKKCSKDEFYDFLRKKVGVDDALIKEKMDKGTFLLKLKSVDNGIIPYQVNRQELEAILDEAEKKFDFLRKRTDGITVKEKIIALMKFRVPYYVGPLTTKGKFSWLKKTEGVSETTPVTPWNFDQVVDRDACEENFITRMTNKCTYLIGEDVIPECSLLYKRFTFLNELNNLRIYGEKNPIAKQLIYNLAKKEKKITLKKCLKVLIENGIVSVNARVDEVFSGLDGDFKTNLASYVDFYNIVGEKVVTDSEMIERIILWITLLSDKSRLEKRIKKEYGSVLSTEEIKKIKGLNYTKWGRFSKALLTEIKSSRLTSDAGEPLSVIEALEQRSENFMELLSDKYDYKNLIDERNSCGVEEQVTYNTIEELYCSPAVKRTIWRAVCLVREIIKVQGGPPKKLFIEMARETTDNGKKGDRTVSRKQQLIDLYKAIGKDGVEWIKEIENTPDRMFNSDKLFFYYTQMGKDAYTGTEIGLNNVFNVNLYDIEHIYPQSKIKDDSLDNRVLVYRPINAGKQDRYPLDPAVQSQMQSYWRELKGKGFISDEKYYRLTRKTSLSDDELADFINRQLVETRQSTKEAAKIFRRIIEGEVVYAKAKNAREFKEKVIRLTKVRELNDLHHAKDAYVNIVIGNIYNEKFQHNAAAFMQRENLKNYNMNRLYYEAIPDVWNPSDIARIKKIANKNSCRVVHFTSEGTGGLFDATIQTHSPSDALIPLKESGPRSNTSKYGGYLKASTAYFMLVQSKNKKGCNLLSIERMTIYGKKRYKDKSPEEYCRDCLGLVQPKVVADNIKINTLFNYNGSYVYIRGVKSNGAQIIFCNANQLILDEDSVGYLKIISNAFRDKQKYKSKELILSDGISVEANVKLYDILTEKLSKKPYDGLNISKQTEVLAACREKFAALDAAEQCKVLWEVLHFMQCNTVTSDLSSIGGNENTGKITLCKNIDKNKTKIFKMISQSPTGHYRAITDLTEYL